MPRRRTDSDPVMSSVLAHRGDGPSHDLVEHLGDDAQRLVAAERDEPLVEGGVGHAERLRVRDRGLFVGHQVTKLRDDRLAPAVGGDGPGRQRFELGPGVEDVGERDVAALQHHRRGARRHALVGLVHDHAAADTPDDGDEALGLEDAQGFAQRGAGDTEALDQVGLVAQRVALGELPGDDQRAQLVGDLLGLLLGASPLRFGATTGDLSW